VLSALTTRSCNSCGVFDVGTPLKGESSSPTAPSTAVETADGDPIFHSPDGGAESGELPQPSA
jgi:hypothetical protein